MEQAFRKEVRPTIEGKFGGGSKGWCERHTLLPQG